MADLRNSSGDVFFDYLFASDANGTVGLVAGRGTQTALGPILHTYLYSRDFTDVERTQFADSGELVFTVDGPDLPGTIVMIATVPEPSWAGLIVAALASLRWRRREQAAQSDQVRQRGFAGAKIRIDCVRRRFL